MHALIVTNSAPSVAQRIPGVGEIVAFRNLLIHGYAAVDHGTVWRTVEGDVPSLRSHLTKLLSELGEVP